MSRTGAEGLPRSIRRLVNLLRRLPFISDVFGNRPVELAVKRLYSRCVSSDDVVVEVGARMGDGTRSLAGMARHVYSFEPSKSNFLVLRTLARTHRNVDVYNVALSDYSGESYLYRDRRFSGVASMKTLNDVNYSSRERVAVGRLDDMSFKLTPTSLVIDCEGSEYDVLKGAKKLLLSLRSVLVETHTLSDGTSTTASVQDELSRFFPRVDIERIGDEFWIVAQK